MRLHVFCTTKTTSVTLQIQVNLFTLHRKYPTLYILKYYYELNIIFCDL